MIIAASFYKPFSAWCPLKVCVSLEWTTGTKGLRHFTGQMVGCHMIEGGQYTSLSLERRNWSPKS